MLAQAIPPAFIAGFSAQGGRRVSFIICFSIYLVANISLALQKNHPTLLVLECMQAFGSTPTIALAIAVAAMLQHLPSVGDTRAMRLVVF